MRRLITIAALMIGTHARAAEVPAAAGNLPAEGQSENLIGKPTVAISRDATRVKLTFTGTLQSTEAVGGPWNDISNAASPFEDDTAGKQKFYRTRETDTGSIFSSRSLVSWTITGPFQTNFDLAFAGIPDGFFPPHREKPYFGGALKMGALDLPVSFRVRGNSSLQECPFPKLKLKISKDHRAGTPFADAREIKIGTHCAEGGRGPIGRLRDETAAYREALAYETMDLMGFISPRVRRARIDYHDTTPANSATVTGWQLSRNAVILDDVEVVAERLGGRALDDEEVAKLTKAGFDEQLIVDLRFLHALLGNWDYRLSSDGQNLWNTEVIELADGKLVPVAGDFDLCSWVTETVRQSAPGGYHPELADVERRARYEIEQIQQSVTKPGFAAASDRFLAKRSAIESQINAALIDDAGRANALRHVTAFFEALPSR